VISLSTTVSFLSALAIAMLWWTLAGYPPHSFFALQTAVLVTSLLSTSLLSYRINHRWLPFSVVLVIVALVHLLGHMRRWEWVPYDVATLVLTVLGLLMSVRYLYVIRRSAKLNIVKE
jgi:hypothetical protein